MKFTIAILSLLAAVAIASPAAVNNNPLEARIDCSHCGCSSAESCTFDCCQVRITKEAPEPTFLTISYSKGTGDLESGTAVRMDAGGGDFSPLYGVLHWSLSSAGGKGSPYLVS
ncbi:hypothetical protein GE09DRAFT_1212717 [Coniochaeta sp. 2T2.1]|nr:hypothetical protein GE09DRAFT_1212717 [Coniochaeta sp. 2T2.1]